MRGGRNKFGPIYRRDRALRRQLQTLQFGKAISDVQGQPLLTSGPLPTDFPPHLPVSTSSGEPYGENKLSIRMMETSSDADDVKPAVTHSNITHHATSGPSASSAGFQIAVTSIIPPSSSQSHGIYYDRKSSSDARTSAMRESSRMQVSTDSLTPAAGEDCQSSEIETKLLDSRLGLSDMAATFLTQFISEQHLFTQSAPAAKATAQSSYHVLPPPPQSVSSSSRSSTQTSAMPSQNRAADSSRGIFHTPQEPLGDASVSDSIQHRQQALDQNCLMQQQQQRATFSVGAASPSDAVVSPVVTEAASEGCVSLPPTLQLIVELRKDSLRLHESNQKLCQVADDLLRQLNSTVAELHRSGVMRNFEEKVRASMIHLFCRLCDQALFILVSWSRRAHFFRDLTVSCFTCTSASHHVANFFAFSASHYCQFLCLSAPHYCQFICLSAPYYY